MKKDTNIIEDEYVNDNTNVDIDDDYFDPVEDSYDRDVEAFQAFADREFD
jgi:hypothetical protein